MAKQCDNLTGTMDRQAFLDWAADLLGINHTGGRPYVSKRQMHLNLGIDAEVDGTVRVHLFSVADDLVAWMESQPQSEGPLPAVARPVFRQGASGGDRHYYGFTWTHESGADYAGEQAAVQEFVAWLRGVANEEGIAF